MAHPGDPSPRSPANVLKDRTYKAIVNEQLANSTIKLIVFHRGTETYWQVIYQVFDDTRPATWEEVVPVVKTIIEYVLKS